MNIFDICFNMPRSGRPTKFLMMMNLNKSRMYDHMGALLSVGREIISRIKFNLGLYLGLVRQYNNHYEVFAYVF